MVKELGCYKSDKTQSLYYGITAKYAKDKGAVAISEAEFKGLHNRLGYIIR